MDKASEAILALKPVTFHYKNDMTRYLNSVLVAEDVAEVNPDLVVRDENGKTLHRPLRGGERDVAQRVPQRTQEDRGTGSQQLRKRLKRIDAAAKAN